MVPVSVPLKLPPPVALLKVIKVEVERLEGLPLASCDCTVTLNAVPAVPEPGTVVYTSFVAVPAVPVAVKVNGEPVRDPLVAVKVFEPTVVPKVQLPTVAIPLTLVVADAPVTEPPPVATAKVTLTPLTGLLLTSFTITLGGVDTAVPAVAD